MSSSRTPLSPTRTRKGLGRALALALGASALALAPATSASAADEPIDGPQTSGDSLFPNVGNGGYDVSHYDLDIAWTPGVTLAASTIDATAAIDAVTTGAPLKSFSFDFEGPNLTVSSVTVNGEPATVTRDEQPSIIKHKLVVTPATPVTGAFTTVVSYSGTPSRHTDADGSFEGWNVTADGATFLNQPIGAMTGYPNNNTPADKATYDISVDIPNTITNTAGTGNAAAASNGELISKVANGATRTTWNWEQTKPMASELAMISIGKYDVLTSEVSLADGRVLPEWSFVDSSISSGTKTSINTQRARFPSVINGLAGIFGPYPGNSLGVVVDVVPSGISYALETQDRSFFPGSISAGTFVHEAAHQWYGNNVAPADWNDLYINEGMATWAPTWFNNEGTTPPASAASTEATYYASWAGISAEDARWTIPPNGMTDPADLYDFQSYTRGAMFWEALRLSVGDDDFFSIVKEWQRRYAGESHGTADLEELAEQLSGEDLTAFFQDWVKDADKPAWPQRFDYAFEAEASSTPLAGGETVSYYLSAANRGYAPLTDGVVEVDLSDVLDDATLDLESLPADLTLDGTTLRWAVPATARGGRQVSEFTVSVDPAASAAELTATATSPALAAFCATGTTCTRTFVVPEQPVTGTPDPSLSGVERVGELLTVDKGVWEAGTAVQWYRGARVIAGETGDTYRLTAADLGRDVSVVVTYSAPGYSAITKSDTTDGDIAAGLMTRTPTPRIQGLRRVGELLTAVPGAVDSGAKVSYRWLANGTVIAGATGRTYRIPSRLLGKVIRVRTIITKLGYVSVTRTSAPTSAVRR